MQYTIEEIALLIGSRPERSPNGDHVWKVCSCRATPIERKRAKFPGAVKWRQCVHHAAKE